MGLQMRDIMKQLNLRLLTKGLENNLDREVSKGYVSDLLSDVLANAPRGGVLVTLQTHLNVIAVATHAELSGIIFIQGRMPEDSTIEKAEQEGIMLFTSPESAFEVVGQLYSMGIRG